MKTLLIALVLILGLSTLSTAEKARRGLRGAGPTDLSAWQQKLSLIHPRQKREVQNTAKELMLQSNRVPKGPADSQQSGAGHENSVLVPDDTCEDCKVFVQRLKEALRDPIAMVAVQTETKSWCNFLGTHSAECHRVVESLPKVLQRVRPLLEEPALACDLLRICGTSEVAPIHKLFLLLLKHAFSKAGASVLGDVECHECVFVIGEFKKIVDNQGTQIKGFLKGLCKKVSSLEGECESLLDQYLPILLKELDSILSQPKDVCSSLSLCSSKEASASGFHLLRQRGISSLKTKPGMKQLYMMKHIFSRLQTSMGFNVSCLVCEASLDVLLGTLENSNETLWSMAGGLRSEVCGLFPTADQNPCNDFMGIYLEPVIVLTLEQLSGMGICQAIQVCTNSETNSRLGTSANELASYSCEACRLSSNFFQFQLQQKAFQEDISDLFKEACKALPEKSSGQCQNIIDVYARYILGNIVAFYARPDIMCSALSMCPK